MQAVVRLNRRYKVGIGFVHAPYYPTQREEGWWVVVGDPTTNQVHCLAVLPAPPCHTLKPCPLPAVSDAGCTAQQHTFPSPFSYSSRQPVLTWPSRCPRAHVDARAGWAVHAAGFEPRSASVLAVATSVVGPT